jgi:hypothetical protein
MPARILLSHIKALGFDFATEVARHRQDLADWAARPADWDPCPPPAPLHPLVATAVTVGTYEIHDDTPAPPAPPALEERQHKLAEQVRTAQAAAAAAVIHPLRRPLIELQTLRASRVKFEERTLGDREALNNRKGLDERLAAIELHAAEQLAEISTLNDETIERWQPTPFPEGPSGASRSLDARKALLAADVDAEAIEAGKRVQHPLKRDLVQLRAAQAFSVEEEKRTDDDKKAIGELNAVSGQLQVVALHAANLKAAIADLDESSIETWKPAAFPV